MKNPIVSLVFPLWNNPAMTLVALESLKKVNAGVEYEVILVDDCSTEDMTPVFSRSDLYQQGIRLKKNTGNSTEVVNKGILISSGKYIQYQNNDVEFVQDGWLKNIVDAFESDDTIGVVGCKTLYKNNTVNHSMRRWLTDDSSQSSSHYERGKSLEDSSTGINECEIVAGCGMTMRKDLLDKFGLLSVYKPFGWDDADYCFRMRLEGYKVVCQSDSHFIHHGSVSYGRKETPEYYQQKKILEDKYKDLLK